MLTPICGIAIKKGVYKVNFGKQGKLSLLFALGNKTSKARFWTSI